MEIGWLSEAARTRFQDASSILFSDEQNVFEETVAYALPEGSRTVVDRDPDATPNGTDRYDREHVHFTPHPGQRDALSHFLNSEFAPLAAASDDVVKVRIHAPEPHDNSTPNPPAPRVEHTVGDERIDLVIIEIAFADALARRRFFASAAFRATLDEQERLARHITAFPVSGVFTFVRNEALTTAGIRGSRVAELIADLAAAHQVSDRVVTLMRRGLLQD